MNFKIRKFQPSDLDEVMRLFYDVVHSVGSKYYTQKQLDAWAPEHGLDSQAWLKSLTQNYTYVAKRNNTIVGFGDMTKEGYIDHLFVAQKHQGVGVALKIYAQFEQDAKKLGLRQLYGNASIMLKPLAEKKGFKVVEKQVVIRNGVEIVNYKMKKSLA